MKQLIAAILVLFTACVFAQEQAKIIECSVSPSGKTCFAEKPKKDAKLATVEWSEYMKRHEYSYVQKIFVWVKVRTEKMNNAGWDWPSGGSTVSVPLHIPPYRNDGRSSLIIVTPTISGEPYQK